MIERAIEWALFASRWLLAPLFLGLSVALVPLAIAFARELVHLCAVALTASETDIILALLSLVDLAMTGALLIIVIFSGYQNFVSRVGFEDHKDWPEWMGTIDFAGLKIKVLSSIVAISAIELLKEFMALQVVTPADERRLFWLVVIHAVFVASSVILALADRLSGVAHGVSADKA